jgi:signal transduction histidine kinase
MREDRGLRVENSLARESSSHVRADETRLRQVIINLISNAIRYNHEKGSVTIKGSQPVPGFFRISVEDTGQGIPNHEQANVFHLFHQVGNHPDLATDGTGIGLYVSKLLIEKMDGKIGFESTDGVGSTFWIDLPLAVSQGVSE